MSTDFFTTTLAHELDPDAEPGSDWAEFAACAAYALKLAESRGHLPPVPIDPEAQSTYERPNRQWGAADDKRLDLALRLLELVESGDTEKLEKLAECLKDRRQRGIPPNPTMRTFENLTQKNMRAGKMEFPTKQQVQIELERHHFNAAPRSKKARWKHWRRHALSWLKQKR